MAAVVLAVALVFTFVGMPVGGKLFGTVMTINGRQYDIKPDAGLMYADLRGAIFNNTTMPDGSIRTD